MIVFALTAEEILDRSSRIEELLASIAQGNTRSMGLLYDLIKTDVFAYALSKTGRKQDAEDLSQDTFVQIYKYAKQYKPRGKPMAWIIRIELNLIRRHFQLKKRMVEFDEGFENTVAVADFEENVINNAFLRELIHRLGEEEREIIALHVVSGMKHREIATLLQKPLSTVLSKYNRAIQKLRLIVKEGKE